MRQIFATVLAAVGLLGLMAEAETFAAAIIIKVVAGAFLLLAGALGFGEKEEGRA